MADDKRLVDVAGAILDGSAVDWASAESSGSDPELLHELKLLATVADVHRQVGLGEWAHLRILERIAAGSSGEVYRAWDTRLDREVALKLLPVDSLLGERTSTIIHEGRLLARVRHPNVVTIYGAEQIGNRIGLWMEFVRGRTLEQHLQSGADFSVERVLQVGIEVCRAVSAVHGAGLVHRDIKAQNVMLADDERVLLMDLGTGREAGDREASDLTGTPLYLAPEVFDGQPAGARSDIYSIGVLLYHLVTRSYPVDGRSAREVAAKQARGERTSLTNTRGDLPPDFVRIVERALARNPEERYDSANAMQADLSQALAEVHGASAMPETTGRRAWLWRSTAAIVVTSQRRLLGNDGGHPRHR